MTATAVDAALRRLEARDDEVRAESRPSRQVVVLSPKGGCGRTTVATNLAIALAERGRGDVGLADLDLAFGDVATALLLDPRAGLHRLASAPRPLTAAAVNGVLERHPSGLYVLCGPEDPVAGEAIGRDDVRAVLTGLSATLETLVVDTPSGLHDVALVAAERATDLVLVAALEVPTLLALRQALDALDLLGLRGARRHVVVNRGDVRAGIDLADVETTLGLPVTAVVPQTDAAVAAMNEGRPLVLRDPKDPAARAFRRLAEAIDPTGAAPAEARRRWRRAAR